MRVFLALLPDDKSKAKLHALARKMKSHSTGGNFTTADNFHVTLVFIGDVSEATVEKIKTIVNETRFTPFVIKTRHMGFFSNKGNKDILVWHVDKSHEINQLYETMFAKLIKIGFELDDREFRPHFTLARKASFPEEFTEKRDSLQTPVMFMKCDRLCLMESLKVGGKLVYKELFGKTMETPSEKKL